MSAVERQKPIVELCTAGYDAKEGSLMAKLNVRGNAMMEQLSKDLDFPFKRIGSLVICLREEDMDKLQALYDRGVANGVSGLQILNREEVLEMEPNIADNVYAALYAPTAGNCMSIRIKYCDGRKCL